MIRDIDGGMTAATRLAGGAPLETTLDVTDPGDWLALDAAVREVAWYRGAAKPDGHPSLPLPADLDGFDESRLALALCHRNGWTRQGAVSRAVRYPRLLPLVVVRSADWAGPVREAARQVLRETLDADSAVRVAPLLLRVGRRERGAFGTELLGRVLRGASREHVALLFADPDRNVRRFAYRLAVDGGLLGPAELARAAVGDPDSVVQDVCATAALSALGDEKGAYEKDVNEEVLSALLSARNPRTRSAGVTGLRRAGRPGRAEPYLTDGSGLVRACARYVVRQHGVDPADWYRRRCATADTPGSTPGATPGPPPGAVVGLAECGDRADAELLRPLLTHPDARVRARAVAGLRTLDCVDPRQIRPLLDDPSAHVVREAVTALLPGAADLPSDWLAERTGPGHPRHVRLGAFRLLDASGGIAALRAAVALLEDQEVKLRTWAGQSVQRWHPSPDLWGQNVEEVGELLDRSRHLFSDYVLSRRKWEAGLRG
ncbi:hypothetical protein [Streptomyces aureus]